jgi:hypothetical protein
MQPLPPPLPPISSQHLGHEWDSLLVRITMLVQLAQCQHHKLLAFEHTQLPCHVPITVEVRHALAVRIQVPVQVPAQKPARRRYHGIRQALTDDEQMRPFGSSANPVNTRP